jgi:hypothetical protein
MERSIDVMTVLDSVHLTDLPPMTTLLIWTTNSFYRVVVADGMNVYVQGGMFFPEPTSAHVDGASTGNGMLMVGWIGVGLLIEFHAGDIRVVTSPVRAITRERSGYEIVH